MTDEDSQARELDILLTEYKARRDEILMLSQRYGRLMMSVISSNSIIIAVGRMVAGYSWPEMSAASASSVAWAQAMLLLAVPAFAYYLMASTMDALYMLQLNGLRCGELEMAINRITGKRLLAWESGVMSDTLWAGPGKRKFLWVKPNMLQAAILCLLMVVANYVLSMLAQDVMGIARWGYTAALWGMLIFLIWQWQMLLGRVRKDLAARIADVSSQQL